MNHTIWILSCGRLICAGAATAAASALNAGDAKSHGCEPVRDETFKTERALRDAQGVVSYRPW